jgi:hypothetical protein
MDERKQSDAIETEGGVYTCAKNAQTLKEEVVARYGRALRSTPKAWYRASRESSSQKEKARSVPGNLLADGSCLPLSSIPHSVTSISVPSSTPPPHGSPTTPLTDHSELCRTLSVTHTYGSRDATKAVPAREGGTHPEEYPPRPPHALHLRPMLSHPPRGPHQSIPPSSPSSSPMPHAPIQNASQTKCAQPRHHPFIPHNLISF